MVETVGDPVVDGVSAVVTADSPLNFDELGAAPEHAAADEPVQSKRAASALATAEQRPAPGSSEKQPDNLPVTEQEPVSEAEPDAEESFAPGRTAVSRSVAAVAEEDVPVGESGRATHPTRPRESVRTAADTTADPAVDAVQRDSTDTHRVLVRFAERTAEDGHQLVTPDSAGPGLDDATRLLDVPALVRDTADSSGLTEVVDGTARPLDTALRPVGELTREALGRTTGGVVDASGGAHSSISVGNVPAQREPAAPSMRAVPSAVPHATPDDQEVASATPDSRCTGERSELTIIAGDDDRSEHVERDETGHSPAAELPDAPPRLPMPTPKSIGDKPGSDGVGSFGPALDARSFAHDNARTGPLLTRSADTRVLAGVPAPQPGTTPD